jgi:hypothetical protein
MVGLKSVYQGAVNIKYNSSWSTIRDIVDYRGLSSFLLSIILDTAEVVIPS